MILFGFDEVLILDIAVAADFGVDAFLSAAVFSSFQQFC